MGFFLDLCGTDKPYADNFKGAHSIQLKTKTPYPKKGTAKKSKEMVVYISSKKNFVPILSPAPSQNENKDSVQFSPDWPKSLFIIWYRGPDLNRYDLAVNGF